MKHNQCVINYLTEPCIFKVDGYEFQFLQNILEIKDKTNKKLSIIYHICFIVLEKYPDSTDLSELVHFEKLAKVITERQIALLNFFSVINLHKKIGWEDFHREVSALAQNMIIMENNFSKIIESYPNTKHRK